MSSSVEENLIIKDSSNVTHVLSKSIAINKNNTSPTNNKINCNILKSCVNVNNDDDDNVCSSSKITCDKDKQTSAEINKFKNVQNSQNVIVKLDTTTINFTDYWNRSMILHYGREFICILALILTTYATLQNVPPKISKVPPPSPFFPKGSLVQDWPSGELKTVQNRVSLSDLSFVMFYAPWCAESQYARSSFEHVARLFYREASFAAVNCWQPGGECRQHYTKVMSWPVLMAYLQNGIAIPYTGKWTNSALTKFILSMVTPLKRITNTVDLLNLLIKHDAVITLFLNVENDKKLYSVFYQAAVKWIEKDPFQDVAFAIVTGESVKEFGVDDSPSIRMYLWNETLITKNNSFSSIDLHKYIIDNLHQLSFWLSPPGTKSSTFAPHFENGPIFILFTPRNLYSDSMGDAYKMIKQIGTEYYNCDNNDYLSKMSNVYIAQQRHEIHKNYINTKNYCENLLKSNVIKNINDDGSGDNECSRFHKKSGANSISIAYDNVLNYSKLSDITSKKINDACEIITNRNGKQFCIEENEINLARKKWHCNFGTSTAATNSYFTTFISNIKISMLQTEYDNRSPQNLIKTSKKKQCELFLLSERNEPTIFFENIQHQQNFSIISGLGCKQNKTLVLATVDSLSYHTFAERLGIDILNYENKTVAVIIDHENETTHVLNKNISATNIINFISDFTNHKLSRHLKNVHLNFKDDNSTKTINDNANLKSNNTINLFEINSTTFDKYVIHSTKTVIVLFYTVQCALCTLMTQSLLMSSKILSDFRYLDFVRINSDKNDLPWQYTMDVLPTLLIFPMDRKSESRKFPVTIKVNVPNVLGFILANLNRPQRLHALILICKSSKEYKKISPLEGCLNVLRNEITDNIQISLRQWRKYSFQRNQILRRIQILQNVYLQLFKITNIDDFDNLLISVKDIIKIWTLNNNNE